MVGARRSSSSPSRSTPAPTSAGISFGKHPMAPRISPKKTWEGFAGAARRRDGRGRARRHVHARHSWWIGSSCFGILILGTATAGDLGESHDQARSRHQGHELVAARPRRRARIGLDSILPVDGRAPGPVLPLHPSGGNVTLSTVTQHRDGRLVTLRAPATRASFPEAHGRGRATKQRGRRVPGWRARAAFETGSGDDRLARTSAMPRSRWCATEYAIASVDAALGRIEDAFAARERALGMSRAGASKPGSATPARPRRRSSTACRGRVGDRFDRVRGPALRLPHRRGRPRLRQDLAVPRDGRLSRHRRTGPLGGVPHAARRLPRSAGGCRCSMPSSRSFWPSTEPA